MGMVVVGPDHLGQGALKFCWADHSFQPELHCCVARGVEAGCWLHHCPVDLGSMGRLRSCSVCSSRIEAPQTWI